MPTWLYWDSDLEEEIHVPETITVFEAEEDEPIVIYDAEGNPWQRERPALGFRIKR